MAANGEIVRTDATAKRALLNGEDWQRESASTSNSGARSGCTEAVDCLCNSSGVIIRERSEYASIAFWMGAPASR